MDIPWSPIIAEVYDPQQGKMGSQPPAPPISRKDEIICEASVGDIRVRSGWRARKVSHREKSPYWTVSERRVPL